MRTLIKSAIAALALALAGSASAQTVSGWPAAHKGVMLQGFYWDSYTDTNWANLTKQADELSQYFNLIWVPNSGLSAGGRNMGYMPIYYFQNHNSAFGIESALRTMIKTYKAKGVGIIEDVVLNHRVGVRGFVDFATETWNGNTYTMDENSITGDDDEGYGRGAADTGEGFVGARDLDHTNANVQYVLKDYCKFLLDDMGYAGFRLDMVKGYAPRYTKMYNEYAKPQYSVGEYFDYSYDAVAAWIDGTGKTSAAFDFPAKDAINKAFGSGDLSQLVWMAPGNVPQPAGLIHYGYQQLAVTFIDNHDTGRSDSGNTFSGNVVAANAYILACPGTPCIFLPHWQQYKDQIAPIIKARNDMGVTNTSRVNVLKTNSWCYMAEIIGTEGRMAVRIGNTSDTPAGYTNLVASGDGYSVWTSTGGGEDPEPQPIPGDDDFTVYFDNAAAGWQTPHIHYWGGAESTWPGVAMSQYDGTIWSYTVPAATTGLLFNAGDGDATKTADFAAVADHVYTTAGDQGPLSDYQGGGTPTVEAPDQLFLVGNLDGYNWDTANAMPMARDGNAFTANSTALVAVDGNENAYFSFITATGASWDVVNASDRYGAATADAQLTPDVEAPMLKYPVNVSASSAKSWAVAPGVYNIRADFATMTVTVSEAAGVSDITADDDAPATYYNLQGVPVANPVPGTLYIRLRGTRADKVLQR